MEQTLDTWIVHASGRVELNIIHILVNLLAFHHLSIANLQPQSDHGPQKGGWGYSDTV